jgi:hypothetical protein
MKYKITVGQVWVQVLGVGLVVLGGVKISVVRILKMLLFIQYRPDPGTK